MGGISDSDMPSTRRIISVGGSSGHCNAQLALPDRAGLGTDWAVRRTPPLLLGNLAVVNPWIVGDSRGGGGGRETCVGSGHRSGVVSGCRTAVRMRFWMVKGRFDRPALRHAGREPRHRNGGGGIPMLMLDSAANLTETRRDETRDHL